jgi:hypothetical protein
MRPMIRTDIHAINAIDAEQLAADREGDHTDPTYLQALTELAVTAHARITATIHAMSGNLAGPPSAAPPRIGSSTYATTNPKRYQVKKKLLVAPTVSDSPSRWPRARRRPASRRRRARRLVADIQPRGGDRGRGHRVDPRRLRGLLRGRRHRRGGGHLLRSGS